MAEYIGSELYNSIKTNTKEQLLNKSVTLKCRLNTGITKAVANILNFLTML